MGPFYPGWSVVPGEVATAVKMSQLGANDDHLKAGLARAVPAGTIAAFVGNTAPAGWLICDGSPVSRSTYADLFAVLGTARGAGNGSTTFNLPNYRGRTIVGYDSSQAEFNEIGRQGGAKSVTLSWGQMPSHNHGMNNAGQHTHGLRTEFGSNDALVSPGQFAQMSFSAGRIEQFALGAGDHNHYIQPAGNNEAHENLQPYGVESIIIKY